jgi:SAM-dependent methyltransferase
MARGVSLPHRPAYAAAMRRVEDVLTRRPLSRRLVSRTVYAGHSVQCACCNSAFRRFAPMWGNPDRMCWNCGALERHREIALLIQNRPRLLLGSKPSRYVTADLDAPGVDMNFDLTAAPLADDSFDVIMCNHVLEHIPDDQSALRELRRILAPGGWASLMTPILIKTTIEDPTVTDPQERLRRFGQADHVRRYGWDYLDRLRDAGFAVEVVRLENDLPAVAIHRHQLRNPEGFVEPIFLAS